MKFLLAFFITFPAFAGTLTFRLLREPDSLDWQASTNPILMSNLMEGLVAFDVDLKAVPQLAKSWTVSADGRIFTFEIKKGIKWSDGVELKAQDFVFAWKRLISKESALPHAYYLFDIDGAEAFNSGKIPFAKVGLRKIDDSRFEVKLRAPNFAWASYLARPVTFPLREDIVAKYGSAWSEPGKIVTLGPYALESVEKRQRYILKRVRDASGNVDKAIGLVVEDDRTALDLFRAGKLDYAENIPVLSKKDLAGTSRFPELSTVALCFNIRNSLVQKSALRKAIAMAIDKSKFLILEPEARSVADSWVAPELLPLKEKVGIDFDPESARRELAASGFDPKDHLKILTASMGSERKIAEYIQEELKKNLNLKVDIQSFEMKTVLRERRGKAYPMFFRDWNGDYPDPDSFLRVLTSASGDSHTGWTNDEFDELVRQARGEKNSANRERKYVAALRLLEQKRRHRGPPFSFVEPNDGSTEGKRTGKNADAQRSIRRRSRRLKVSVHERPPFLSRRTLRRS